MAGSIPLTIPVILVTLLGTTIFNFIVQENQRRLFANEILQKDKQEEQMKIIDMFQGHVFILDARDNSVLFVKGGQEIDFPFVLNEATLRLERVF